MFRFKHPFILVAFIAQLLISNIISTAALSQNNCNIATHTIYNTPINTRFIRQYSATVVVFLAPECPICIDYIPTLKQLHSTLKNNNIQLIGVFSGGLYTTKEYQQFATYYNVTFTLLNDKNRTLQHALNATHTPHCMLLNNRGQIVYSGKLDNKNEALGAHKNKATINYLQDNITAFVHKQKLVYPTNTPVGCLIE